jgi:hypothetical protein
MTTIKRIWIWVFCFLVVQALQAQEWEEATNRAYFRSIYQKLSEEFWAEKKKAEAFALEKSLPVRGTYRAVGDDIYEIIQVTPDGLPIYLKTYNRLAGVTSGTQRLYRGGGLGLDLTGEGLLVGVWDGTNFLETHREFGGRARSRGTLSDVIVEQLGGDHSTHVTGTIVAAGVNPEARGMAPRAEAFVYDFFDDDAEIAAELARPGQNLLLSNHSYGLILGWFFSGNGWRWFGNPAISAVEDYRFGFYDEKSRRWDEFAFNAPFYLMVTAAGNDRNDVGNGPQPPDGPYDVLGNQAVAKNVLTVGAVNTIGTGYRSPADVVMSEFSSWGPTDDGRVKPDLVAAGVGVLSAGANNVEAYTSLSGTSMATPATTGSLLLLQQLYSQVNNGNYMRSATLRGLAIHTVHATGANAGPDYQHGWGLLSTDKAASLITRTDDASMIIREQTLRNGQTIFLNVESNGVAPLIATICWTDPPGTPVAPRLDPTDLMLVNDLDIRIVDENGNEFLPWILDPSRPDQPATRGNNIRDNVEKIEITIPQPGLYTLIISHKGTLRNNQQNFSLIVSSQDLSTNLTTLYWIGQNGGNWNNGANWSLTSGGAPANRVPTLETPVIFDNNSFGPNPVTISLNNDANCYNLSWVSNQNGTFQLNDNTLNINGSLDLAGGTVTFNGGTLEFNGQITKRNFIKAPGNSLRNVDILIRGNRANWNLLTDLNTRNIRIEGGALSIVDKNLSAQNLQVPFGSRQGLNVRGSRVLIANEIVFNSTDFLTNFENSTLVFNNQGGQNVFALNGAGRTFHNIEVNGVSLTINGNSNFNRIDVNGTLTLNGNATIDSLVLSPGATLSLGAERSFTIREAFQAVGNSNNRINIRSTGAVANIITDNPELRFCFDFLNINDVAVSGQTDFVTGNNSTLNPGSQGWFVGDCDDALFADFAVVFACELGTAEFTDRTTGSPTSWLWDFGDPQFPDRNTSTLRNPTHVYSFQGNYLVSLTVSDGTLTRTVRRQITVRPNTTTLAVPVIEVNGQTLQSSVISNNYQWFQNGVPIPNATGRSIQVSSSAAYTVQVFNDQCKFTSQPVVVGQSLDDRALASFELFPNPTERLVNLSFAHPRTGQLAVILYNAQGQQVYSFQTMKQTQDFQLEIELGHLPTGIYQCTVVFGGERFVKKLLKP